MSCMYELCAVHGTESSFFPLSWLDVQSLIGQCLVRQDCLKLGRLLAFSTKNCLDLGLGGAVNEFRI